MSFKIGGTLTEGLQPGWVYGWANKTASLGQGYLSQNGRVLGERGHIGMATVHPSLPDLKQLYKKNKINLEIEIKY